MRTLFAYRLALQVSLKERYRPFSILLPGIISLPTDPVHEGGDFNLAFRLFEHVSIEYKVDIMNREIVSVWSGFSGSH